MRVSARALRKGTFQLSHQVTRPPVKMKSSFLSPLLGLCSRLGNRSYVTSKWHFLRTHAHQPAYDPEQYGIASIASLMANDCIIPELECTRLKLPDRRLYGFETLAGKKC